MFVYCTYRILDSDGSTSLLPFVTVSLIVGAGDNILSGMYEGCRMLSPPKFIQGPLLFAELGIASDMSTAMSTSSSAN